MIGRYSTASIAGSLGRLSRGTRAFFSAEMRPLLVLRFEAAYSARFFDAKMRVEDNRVLSEDDARYVVYRGLRGPGIYATWYVL